MKRAFLLVLPLFLLTGCLVYTPEQQARFDAVLHELSALKSDAADVERKIRDGTLSVADGTALLLTIQAKSARLEAEWNSLKGSGLGTWEIIGGLLTTVITSLLGLRGAQKLRPEKEGFLGI